MRRLFIASWLLIAGLGPACSETAAQRADPAARLDAIFDEFTGETPGCAIGIAPGAGPAIARAYGLADLERGVKITPETIFEAGSVSKQFTAAAVLLLAQEGMLSLDDRATKYIPELGDHAADVTIRQMLTHTSGLRDWGNLAAIAGWPRTTRRHTHAHVLDIVSRQRALNFAPGTRWSYSNTGYNLAAIIVSRVSGMPFAEFTRERLFAPLGMTMTSWRDDHTRVVRRRAISYSREADGYHTLMPFENVHGNGGLLTTVGDLLTWSAALDAGRVGGESFVRALEEPGRLASGRAHGYALGLAVGEYKGVREISHGGATAGYRSYLARYPRERVSVAVLCNAAPAGAAGYAHAAADLFVPGIAGGVETAAYAATSADLERLAGLYRDAVTGRALELVAEGARLRVARGPELAIVSGSQFTTPDGRRWALSGTRLVSSGATGDDLYERVERASPSVAQLAALAGTYASEEAESTMSVAVDKEALILRRRPDDSMRLVPLYTDAFGNPEIGTVIFRRDAAGRANALSIVQDRVWNLRFARQD